jgi:hypothetical protein
MKTVYVWDAIRIFMQFVLPSAISLAALPVCLKMLGRMKRLEAQIGRTGEELNGQTSILSKDLAALKTEVETSSEAAPAVPLSAGSNATVRAKVLKMNRLGQSVDQIAESLHLSRGEVLLLLKVHRIVLRTFEADQKDAEMPIFDIKTLNGLAG